MATGVASDAEAVEDNAAVGRELYVYYKVRAESAAAASTAVHAFQQELRAETPGLVARLLRRPAERDGVQTWMETYAIERSAGAGAGPRAEGVGATLQSRIEHGPAGLAPHLAGPRHVEVFVALERTR